MFKGFFTLQLSASFTPTSVIKKMYESKEKSRDDPGSRPGSKEETVNSHSSQEGTAQCIQDTPSDQSGSEFFFVLLLIL